MSLLSCLRSLRFARTPRSARRRGFPNRPARPRCVRPRLERLEDRVVPTIVFEPHYGAESASYNGGQVLGNTPVYLLFWGSYWNTSAGSASENELISAVTNEYNSPIYNRLSQYGDSHGNTAGPAYFLQSWTATEDADPSSNGFTDGQLQSVITDAINDSNSPIDAPSAVEATDGGHAPIYLVITPPNIPYAGGSGYLGYHSQYTANTYAGTETAFYGWIGNLGGPTGLYTQLSAQDFVTQVVSHETAEALTDPMADQSSWQVTPGASWPYGSSPNEIAISSRAIPTSTASMARWYKLSGTRTPAPSPSATATPRTSFSNPSTIRSAITSAARWTSTAIRSPPTSTTILPSTPPARAA